MKTLKLPPIETLNNHFDLDIKNGCLKWKNPTSNRVKIGQIASVALDSGYCAVTLHGKTYLTHRVIFKMFYGIEPKCIDHKDGNTKNNKPYNLKSVSFAQNAKNQKRRNTNISGHTGVSWDKQLEKWVVKIGFNYKNIHIGYFINKKDAILARKKAEIKYGYEKNHGRL